MHPRGQAQRHPLQDRARCHPHLHICERTPDAHRGSKGEGEEGRYIVNEASLLALLTRRADELLEGGSAVGFGEPAVWPEVVGGGREVGGVALQGIGVAILSLVSTH